MVKPQRAKFASRTWNLDLAPPDLVGENSEAPWSSFSEMLNGQVKKMVKLDFKFSNFVINWGFGRVLFLSFQIDYSH